MPWFSKKNDAPNASAPSLSDDQKIELVNSAYAEFERRLSEIERERDRKIGEILRIIDERKIHDILHRVDQK